MGILISNMYSATPLSLNRKEGITRDSFQREITIAGYLSGKFSKEAELNGKDGTTRDSFQWEITSLGVLNLK